MSVSMRSTKLEMYNEIELLRTMCDKLQNQALSAKHEVRNAPEDKSFAEFCAWYCTANNVRSVPGAIANEWRAAQLASQS